MGLKVDVCQGGPASDSEVAPWSRRASAAVCTKLRELASHFLAEQLPLLLRCRPGDPPRERRARQQPRQAELLHDLPHPFLGLLLPVVMLLPSAPAEAAPPRGSSSGGAGLFFHDGQTLIINHQTIDSSPRPHCGLAERQGLFGEMQQHIGRTELKSQFFACAGASARRPRDAAERRGGGGLLGPEIQDCRRYRIAVRPDPARPWALL
mmetsp:Transcript_16717/g.41364  ORF Transcript_16717/g.41364 Transcript_16717/m.41364 type:complete len:208 (+) Transcript_16717:1118-1741(+)